MTLKCYGTLLILFLINAHNGATFIESVLYQRLEFSGTEDWENLATAEYPSVISRITCAGICTANEQW